MVSTIVSRSSEPKHPNPNTSRIRFLSVNSRESVDSNHADVRKLWLPQIEHANLLFISNNQIDPLSSEFFIIFPGTKNKQILSQWSRNTSHPWSHPSSPSTGSQPPGCWRKSPEKLGLHPDFFILLLPVSPLRYPQADLRADPRADLQPTNLLLFIYQQKDP